MSPKESTENPIPVRLTKDVIARLDHLADAAEALPEFAVSRVSRSAVLRLAVLRGLEVLEAEVKAKKK